MTKMSIYTEIVKDNIKATNTNQRIVINGITQELSLK